MDEIEDFPEKKVVNLGGPPVQGEVGPVLNSAELHDHPSLVCSPVVLCGDLNPWHKQFGARYDPPPAVSAVVVPDKPHSVPKRLHTVWTLMEKYMDCCFMSGLREALCEILEQGNDVSPDGTGSWEFWCSVDEFLDVICTFVSEHQAGIHPDCPTPLHGNAVSCEDFEHIAVNFEDSAGKNSLEVLQISQNCPELVEGFALAVAAIAPVPEPTVQFADKEPVDSGQPGLPVTVGNNPGGLPKTERSELADRPQVFIRRFAYLVVSGEVGLGAILAHPARVKMKTPEVPRR